LILWWNLVIIPCFLINSCVLRLKKNEKKVSEYFKCQKKNDSQNWQHKSLALNLKAKMEKEIL